MPAPPTDPQRARQAAHAQVEPASRARPGADASFEDLTRVLGALWDIPTAPLGDWCARAAEAFALWTRPAVVIVRLLDADKSALWFPAALGCAAGANRRRAGLFLDAARVARAVRAPLVVSARPERILPGGAGARDPTLRTLFRAGASEVLTGARIVSERIPLALTAQAALDAPSAASAAGLRAQPAGRAAEFFGVVLDAAARRARLAFGGVDDPAEQVLSEREGQVLDAILAGTPVDEIARALERSEHTVRDTLKSLHRRLGVSTRAQLVAVASAREIAPPRRHKPGHHCPTSAGPSPNPNPNTSVTAREATLSSGADALSADTPG